MNDRTIERDLLLPQLDRSKRRVLVLKERVKAANAEIMREQEKINYILHRFPELALGRGSPIPESTPYTEQKDEIMDMVSEIFGVSANVEVPDE